MTSSARAVLQSARIAELKAAAKLVQPMPRVEVPRDAKRRNARLLALIAAERRRNAALIENLRCEA
jgi:hypothetical protein